VGHSCIHHVEHAVNGFVATRSQNRSTWDLSCVGVDDLHEPFVSSFSIARATGHRALADEQRPTSRTCLRQGYPVAPKRRIDGERVSGNPVAHSALLAIEKVCGHGLKIVVGGVGESTAGRLIRR
jgi:hypothetical protein